MHRVGARKIIAGEKDQVGVLPIDGFDRGCQTFEILVAIDMKVAYLTRDDSAQRAGQSAHRQVNLGNLNRVDRAPPHSMQRAQRQGRLGLCVAHSVKRRLVRAQVVD
jgi:hypothetical protein